MPESEEESTAVAEVNDAAGSKDSAVGEEVTLPRSWVALKADRNEPCETCEQYFGKLVPSVEDRLVKLLQGKPAVGGVDLKGSLQQQAPLTMESGGSLQTTKEHWRWDNCRKSLVSKGLYEAPGTMFWISKAPPSWEGSNLPASTITYGMMAAGRITWSDEKFMRSHDDPSKRRYSIRFAIPHQPIRGSLLVGVLARLLDCCLDRWFAGWLVGLLAGRDGWLACRIACLLAVFLAGLLPGWLTALVADLSRETEDRRPSTEDFAPKDRTSYYCDVRLLPG